VHSDTVEYGIKVCVEGLAAKTYCVLTGIEGRAGMAAIVDTANSIDLKQFNRSLQLRLPTYARPIFLRLLDKLDLTGQQWSCYIACPTHCVSCLSLNKHTGRHTMRYTACGQKCVLMAAARTLD